jgi:hypothetical protein
MKNMKSKISKILGVGLMVAMLASMFVVGTPASASTLGWGAEITPNLQTTENILLSGSNIVDLAMAGNGTTIYAVTGALYKSLNSGASWTLVTTAPSGITKVAIAPDSTDGSVLAVIADTNKVYYSIDGGAVWTALADLNPVNDTVASTNASALYCIAFSRTVGITKTLAVGGMNTSNQTGVWYMEFGALISRWVDATQTVSLGWTATNFGSSQAAWALGFSPTNFAGDRALAVVTGPATTAAAGDNLTVKLQVANFFTKFWNAGIVGYTGWGTGLTIDSVTSGNVTQSASLALDPNYLGQSAASRLLYVGLATGDTVNPGGVYRFTDTTRAELLSDISIQSVALNAAGDKLVAGADDTSYVYRLASPATALSTGVLSTSIYKCPGGPVATDVVVTWMGTSVIAGTSGTESAFSISKDDGKSFNDISLIDTVFTTGTMKDFAVLADGTKVYLVNTYGSYTSLWKLTTGTTWERVLVLASNVDFLVRMAPENFDVAYLAMRTSPYSIYYTNDGGNTTWTPRYFATAITDMAVESATVVYVLSTTTVSKSIDAGLIWNGGLAATTIKAGFTGATLTLISAGNLLVGSTDSRVAYSTDGNVSWTVPVPVATAAPITAANVVATADKLSSGGYIYMATYGAANNIYRWNINVSTSWSSMKAAAITYATGIGISQGVLYVVSNNATSGSIGSTLHRVLTPTTVSSATSSGTTEWSSVTASTTGINTAMQFNDTPQSLLITADPASASSIKLWAIDTDVSQMLESYSDSVALSGPTLSAPATGAEMPIDIATGRAQVILFQWGQRSTAYIYQIQIALDSTFAAPIYDAATALDLTFASPKTFVIGPYGSGAPNSFEFLPDTTYYWRVRVSNAGPITSPWSAVFSFKMGGIAVAGISSPAKGAYNVPITPTFVWSEAKGAVLYELEVSTVSTFETTVLAVAPDKAYYQTAETEALDYSTTYYWRVRVPGGTWLYGVFSTMAEPTTPAPPITIAPTVTTTLPAEEINVPIIPTWMLWIIIAIGAVLVIALLVLIIRTRRAA